MNPVIFNDTNDKENYWFFHRMHKVLVETFQDLEFIPPNPNTCETKSIADYESGYYQAFRDIIACYTSNT